MSQCKDCLFAKKVGFDDYQCRKRSPTYETVDACHDLRRHIPVWPIMKGGDWCGEFAPAGCKT